MLTSWGKNIVLR